MYKVNIDYTKVNITTQPQKTNVSGNVDSQQYLEPE